MLVKPFQDCLTWYSQMEVQGPLPPVCPSRDVFQGKLDSLQKYLLNQWGDETESSLLSAVTGELGNNCFDHNLGQWQDVPGCWFQHGMEERWNWVLVADRGQGVLASLKRVLPSLQTDQEALEVAFSKKLSGRSPERRGNGLKFVRSIIHGNRNRGLLFISGKGLISFGGLAATLQKLYQDLKWDAGKGTLACISWGMNQ